MDYRAKAAGSQKVAVMDNYEAMMKKILEQEFGKMNAWQAWAYIINAMACGLSNAFDPDPVRKGMREKEYMDCIHRLDNKDAPAEVLGVIMMAFEKNPNQDFLGKMFMALGLGSHWHGQFFTPYHLAAGMADVSIDKGKAKGEIARKGFISIADCACGAGATLIGAVEALKKRNIDYQNEACFIANDLDRTTAQMCFIQLSLLGCAGYVTVADGLSNPVEGDVLFPLDGGQEFWFTPMWWSDPWKLRRALRRGGRDGGQ